jgi:phospholipid-binding lipoprotein MlaA
LGYPKYVLSDLVQLKFGQALTHTGRFLINSTLGLVGLMDVAKDMGLERQQEDFGIALAYQGVPSGPYIVLPFLGPSNLRDTVGLVFDTIVHPFMFLNYSSVRAGISDKITIGGQTIDILQTRVNLDEAIKAGKESSVDYYLFVQGAYTQYRRGVLYDGNPPEEDFEDLSATPE